MKENPSGANPPGDCTEPEKNVYTGVYRVLLGGMYISSALFAVGIVLALLHPQFLPFTQQWILSRYTVNAVLGGVLHGDPTAIMMIATVILILTPVARVVISIYAFAVDGDRKYVAITTFVLLVMALTVVLGEVVGLS